MSEPVHQPPPEPDRPIMPLERLIAEGRVSRPLRLSLPEPLELAGDPYALSRALAEVRDDR